MKASRRLAVAGALSCISIASAQAGFTVTSIAPSSWGAPDSLLGVAGYAIEDFEDTSLIPGLQIGWTAGSGTLAPSNTLPATFDPRPTSLGGNDAFGTTATAAFYNWPCGSSACTSVWDGSKVLVSGKGNQSYSYITAADWSDVNLLFTSPTKSVGFSLQQNEYPVTIRINGNAGTLTVPGSGGGRYGYVRIDATGTDFISSITLAHTANDAWAIDHLAVAAVPEPASYGLMLAGLGLIGWAARRARPRQSTS